MTFDRKGYIAVESEATGRTTKKGVFAGGDIVTGAATVIEGVLSSHRHRPLVILQ